jgi:NAD(P)-dependent dehydrogenase (short-subunit alcohol dehydrogenase family)
MTTKRKTVIVTGASQGIGAAAPYLVLDRGYNVVGNSCKISGKNELKRSDNLAFLGQISATKDIAEAVATVPNPAQDTFDRLAQHGEQNCPVSRVLRAEITLDARLL